jgi:hypothetical protein
VAVEEFPFAHDRRFALPLEVFGVSPSRAWVRVTDDRLQLRFGFFSADTPLSNVTGVEVTGPYKAYKALGPRLSLVDRGATYGTTAAGGVRISFAEPVRALWPVPSPSLTVTVAEPERFAAILAQRMG